MLFLKSTHKTVHYGWRINHYIFQLKTKGWLLQRFWYNFFLLNNYYDLYTKIWDTFYIIYFSVCAGNFNLTAGSFESPRIGNKSYACEWTHMKSSPVAKETLAIQLTIVGGTKSCHSRRGVLVTEAGFRHTLAQYCGTTLQPIIVRSPLEITELWVCRNDYFSWNLKNFDVTSFFKEKIFVQLSTKRGNKSLYGFMLPRIFGEGVRILI